MDRPGRDATSSVVSGRTSAEARDKLDALRRDLRLGTIAPDATVTVGDYLSGWIERHRTRVRPSTWLTAESHVRVYLIPALGRRPVARLTADDVSDALASFVRDGRPLQDGEKRRRTPVSPVTLEGHYVLWDSVATKSGCHFQVFLAGFSPDALEDYGTDSSDSYSGQTDEQGIPVGSYFFRVVATKCGLWSVSLARR